jgi:hypothetical protein
MVLIDLNTTKLFVTEIANDGLAGHGERQRERERYDI